MELTSLDVASGKSTTGASAAPTGSLAQVEGVDDEVETEKVDLSSGSGSSPSRTAGSLGSGSGEWEDVVEGEKA